MFFLLTIANSLFYYIFRLARYKNQLQRAVLVYSIMQGIMLNALWIVGFGVQGTASFLIFIMMVIVVFTAERPINYVIVIFINMVLLCLLDSYLQTLITFRLPYFEISQKLFLITCIVFMAVLIILYKQLILRRMDKAYYDVMERLDKESNVVNKTADSLAVTSEQLLDFALQQKTATEQLSVTTEELGATAAQNQHLASSAMTTIKQADENVTLSTQSINGLVQSIDRIRQSSSEIQTINNVISDLAFKTNILSLNAMIEASRAGGSNGGFKVVALEVKRLAEHSAKAVDNINQLLDNNFRNVQDSVNLAEEMTRRFKEISDSMKPLVAVIQNVADASVEQHAAIQQITRGIEDIDRAVDQNKNLADKSSSTANQLRSNASSLLNVVKMLQQVLEDM